MKKQYTVVTLLLVTALVLTGCSWNDFKAKLVGIENTDAASASAIASAPVEIEDYDPLACITLDKYKGIEVDCTVSDNEVQAKIDALLQENSTVKKIEKGQCKKGQSVNINYAGKVGGAEFDGGTQDDVTIELGNSGYIEGFDDGVIGMKVGETKDLNLKFPDNYAADLAGKDVVFTVTLNYIEGETVLPKFTDAFVKKYTSYKTIKEYKKETRKSLQEEKKTNAANTAMQTIMTNAVVKKMPETLKKAYREWTDYSQRKYYIDWYKGQYGEELPFEEILKKMQGTMEEYEEYVDTTAENTAKSVLVLQAIAAKENISCTEEDIRAYMDETVSSAAAYYSAYYGDDASYTEEDMKEEYTSAYGEAIPYEDYAAMSCLAQRVTELVDSTLVLKE